MRGAEQLNQQFSGHTGNTVGRAMLARAETPLAEMVKAMAALGHSSTAAGQALMHFADQAGSPKRELQWRLNERLQGRDPGLPTHWRGEHGLRLR